MQYHYTDLLRPQEIQELVSLGATENQLQGLVNEATQETSTSFSQLKNQIGGSQPRIPTQKSMSFFGSSDQEHIIKWQLEVESILERIEHMLKGDVITIENNSIIYKPAESEDDKIFNDRGVKELMRLLSMYINRNTILSNYSEDAINIKMLNLGMDLMDLIYTSYEDFGLDSGEKVKRILIIHREIVDSVHSAYLRALNGEERKGIQKNVSVNQGPDGYGGMNINNYPSPQRTRGFFNPKRYLVGKHV